MAYQTPTFTLATVACQVLKDRTLDLVRDAFARDTGLVRAIVLRHSGLVNAPGKFPGVTFLVDDDAGPCIVEYHDLPAEVGVAIAPATLALAADPKVGDFIRSPARITVNASATRIAINGDFAMSWTPWNSLRHAPRRDNPEAYQALLDKGEAFAGVDPYGTGFSAHARLTLSAAASELGSALYRRELARLSKAKKAGLYRDMRFNVAEAA